MFESYKVLEFNCSHKEKETKTDLEEGEIDEKTDSVKLLQTTRESFQEIKIWETVMELISDEITDNQKLY